MRIQADDWHFNQIENDILFLDLFLDNGQHAFLEVNPIRNPRLTDLPVPEMIVFCEMPGEKMVEQNCPARWLARPPSKECPWSRVELPPALTQQIHERMGQLLQLPSETS